MRGPSNLEAKSLEFILVTFVIPTDVMEKKANIMMQYVAFHTLNFKKKFTYEYLFLLLHLQKLFFCQQ